MLRLASRCIRPPNPTRTLKYFSTIRPNAFHVPRKQLLNPRHHVMRRPSRRFYNADAKPSESLKQPPSSSSPSLSAEDPKLPITQRLRILFKKYRWPALTIYLALSVIDFGIAFLAVRAFGTEKIASYEKIILQKVEDTTGWKTKGTPPQHTPHGGEGGKETASIWTEIALAYTIHKTLFALIRVPVTVAITPPLVKWWSRKGYGAVLAQIPALGRLFQQRGNNTAAASAVVARK